MYEVGLLAGSESRRVYVRLAAVAALVAFLLALYSETFARMAAVWLHSVTFRHGLVIFPICAWLVWSRRHALALVSVRPAWWIVPGLLALTLVWFVAWLADVDVIQEWVLVAMIPALVTAVLGTGIFRALRFPLLYIFFAVPVGWFLVSPLMHVTAFMAVAGLQLSGIPVFQDGFRISVPTGNFLVADACSGIRYLIACLALGTLFAYLFYRTWTKRLAFMVIALLVPILANGIRAYGIILLAYLSDMRIATGFDHVIYGFIFFSFVLLVLFGIGALFRDDIGGAAAQFSPRGAVGDTAHESSRAGPLVGAAAVAMLVIAVGPVMARAWQHAAAVPHPTRMVLPGGGAAWAGPSALHDAWHPRFTGHHRELAGTYSRDNRRVAVYTAAYAYPSRGAGVGDFSNRVAGNPEKLIDSRAHTVPAMRWAGGSLAVRQSIVQDGGSGRLVWSWYRVAGRNTANRVVEKYLEVLDVLRGRSGWARWMSVSTPIYNGLGSAQQTLAAFLDSEGQRLVGCVSGTDEPRCAH